MKVEINLIVLYCIVLFAIQCPRMIAPFYVQVKNIFYFTAKLFEEIEIGDYRFPCCSRSAVQLHCSVMSVALQ